MTQTDTIYANMRFTAAPKTEPPSARCFHCREAARPDVQAELRQLRTANKILLNNLKSLHATAYAEVARLTKLLLAEPTREELLATINDMSSKPR